MTRWWPWLGAAAGFLLGVADLALLDTMGVEMTSGGRDALTSVGLMFAVTFAVLGFAIGRLAQARRRARRDAALIHRQFQDLAETRRAALHNEKLAALGRLSASLAHEVRNPLGVIRSSAALLRDHAALDDTTRPAAAFIVEETDRLNGLVTSLLGFARPTEPRRSVVALDGVVDRAVGLARPEIDRRGITLERADDAAAPAADADPDLIAQVLLGLLVNAAEAVGPGGRIAIRQGTDGDRVTVDVADSGPGIAAELEGRLFEPFVTTKPTGTGLGLPTAAQIVRAHGGSLESVAGQGLGPAGRGACFRLALPAARQDQALAGEPA